MELRFQESTIKDIPGLLHIVDQAFGQSTEADLVAKLLADPTAEPYLSLLAMHHDQAIGHILFTRVYLDRDASPLLHILAPLSVLPQYQKQGIGGQLIRVGLDKLREMGSQGVLVLGHPGYYPKYGFIPDAASQGLYAPYPIPEAHAAAWMIQWLQPETENSWQGTVYCADELQKPGVLAGIMPDQSVKKILSLG